jgi:thioredoxin reductase (NADPH)
MPLSDAPTPSDPEPAGVGEPLGSDLARGPDENREAHLPVLVVVDADAAERATTAAALARRFEPDYRVLTADSAAAGLRVLQGLAASGDAVALVAADLHLPDLDGIAFLERAARLCRGFSRVLLTAMDENHTRIPLTELPVLQRATALGQIDFFLTKGWTDPEEWLYPQVQEALSAWSTAHRPGHVVYRIVGEHWAPRCHDLRDLLTRNGVPFAFHDVRSDTGRRLIRDHGVDVGRLPALIRHDGGVLHDPDHAEIAVSHGIAVRPGRDVHDLVVLGAGPAGLAAAVYGASEGLTTLLLEGRAIGGQAGTSSMIRNYLGFPRGVSGGELAHRGWQQAAFFGVEFVFAQATGLTPGDGRHTLTLTDGSRATGRAVIIATGVSYRRLGIPELDRLVGAGVFYGAAGVEASAITGEDVCVVGGANSAGQAALHLARYAASVTLLVRGASLAASMSDYLIRQLEATPNVTARLGTRVVGGRGDARLTSLIVEDAAEHRREEVPATAVFVLIGAEPHTGWLSDALLLDDRGFLLTGRDVPAEAWPLSREPFSFETSLPGVFAAGDVRLGSVKRCASAVGEGSVAVGSVHHYLAGLALGAESPATAAGSR